jgi:predicted RNase H-like HicB family nuclease
MKYLVVIEKGPTSFGAYVPDLPGCVAVARTRRQVKLLIRQAIQMHVEDMRERGYPIPKPTAASEFVELQPV